MKLLLSPTRETGRLCLKRKLRRLGLLVFASLCMSIWQPTASHAQIITVEDIQPRMANQQETVSSPEQIGVQLQPQHAPAPQVKWYSFLWEWRAILPDWLRW